MEGLLAEHPFTAPKRVSSRAALKAGPQLGSLDSNISGPVDLSGYIFAHTPIPPNMESRRGKGERGERRGQGSGEGKRRKEGGGTYEAPPEALLK